MSDPTEPTQPVEPVPPTQPVDPGPPAPDWPSEPPLGPPPPVVPAPWSDRRPLDPEPPEPPRRDQRAMAALIAALVLAIAGVGIYIAFIRDDGETSATGTVTIETTAPPTTADPGTSVDPTTTSTTTPTDEFDQVVAEIEAFVEAERGLEFKEPVKVELADDAEFEQRLLKDFEEQRGEIEDSDAVLTALGLIDPDVDLVEALREVYSGGVVGFYDPETNELVVRGTSTTPYVRTTIAHELVHALDDQHFELNRPDLDEADDESGFGFSALVEGNAVHVQDLYRETLSAAEQADAAAEEAAIGGEIDIFSIPRVVLDTVVAPYQFGPDLIDALLEAGGQPILDKAFTQPPTTSEQFIDPAIFLANEGRKDVPVPDADGETFDQGSIGAFMLAELLGDVGVGGIGEVVDGWGGDWYVAWHDGDRTCVRAAFEGDTGTDTDEIADALVEWADGTSADASVDAADGTVVITSCG